LLSFNINQALLTFAGTRFIDVTDDVPYFTTQEAGTFD